MPQTSHSRSAFTLVELLVVIAILALIVAMLLPAINAARDAARRTQCQANSRQIGVSLINYVDVHEQFPVAAVMPTLEDGLPPLTDVLADYSEHNESIFRCPSDFEYFDRGERISYEYNIKIAGQTRPQLTRHQPLSEAIVLFDFDRFHGALGQEGRATFCTPTDTSLHSRKEPMNNRRKIVMLLLPLLLLGGAVAWLAFGEKESPEFARIQQLQEKLIDDETLTESEREEGWAEVKRTWPTLSEREQNMLKARQDRKKRAQMDRFFGLATEEERGAYLDTLIDAWEEKAAEKKVATQAKNSNKGNSERKKAPGKPSDPDAMRAGLRKYLDATSPDERVKERIYWTALKERWAARHGFTK